MHQLCAFVHSKVLGILRPHQLSSPVFSVQEPDPNQPKPEGQQMSLLEGERLGVANKWPPSLPAALQRWGTTQPKSPCLTALDNAGKPVYTLTYGGYWPGEGSAPSPFTPTRSRGVTLNMCVSIVCR